MKAHKWRTINNEQVFSTPIFNLHKRRSVHPKRGERDFFVIDPADWVNIIPLTPKREVIMVRQFRHGIGGFTLEIPGGMIDPDDKNPAAAGRREMREECGYDSADIVPLGRVHPNPAIQPNFCYSFLARNVQQTALPHPNMEGSEETEVLVVPLKEVKGLIAQGKITHALVITAFAFFDTYNKPPLIWTKPAMAKLARQASARGGK